MTILCVLVTDAVEKVGGIYIVTSDHGNVEELAKQDKKGEPIVGKDGKVQILTSHTLHPVCNIMTWPLISVVEKDYIYIYG